MDIRDRVAALLIEHPDPDQYDHVWNRAVRAALAEVEAEPTTDTSPRAGKSPLQRRIMGFMADHRPHDERELRRLLFPTMEPADRPRISAALASLARGGLIRRLAGGLERYTLND